MYGNADDGVWTTEVWEQEAEVRRVPKGERFAGGLQQRGAVRGRNARGEHE